jgi:predicted RNase H-like HicB family nuclease
MKLIAIIQPVYNGSTKQFSAYSPDIPGCVAKGSTKNKALEALKTMVTNHVSRMEEVGIDPFRNSCQVEILEIETTKDRWEYYPL